jgi:plastocyanin
LKRSVYIATLSAMVVLVFAAIASAQDSTDQSSSDPNSGGTEQAQSPTPSQQQATPSGQTTSSAQNAPTVSIGHDGFDPAQVQVASGTPVTFVNDDTVSHTVSLDGLLDTQEIPAGASYPVTLDGTGTVTYHDKANPEMKGTITIGGASRGETTTPEGSANKSSQTAGETTA